MLCVSVCVCLATPLTPLVSLCCHAFKRSAEVFTASSCSGGKKIKSSHPVQTEAGRSILKKTKLNFLNWLNSFSRGHFSAAVKRNWFWFLRMKGFPWVYRPIGPSHPRAPARCCWKNCKSQRKRAGLTSSLKISSGFFPTYFRVGHERRCPPAVLRRIILRKMESLTHLTKWMKMSASFLVCREQLQLQKLIGKKEKLHDAFKDFSKLACIGHPH